MLTIERDCGLMRSVARIAQSVEQGIENPRVLGSIPSPGTTILKKPAYGLVFCFVRAEKLDGAALAEPTRLVGRLRQSRHPATQTARSHDKEK